MGEYFNADEDFSLPSRMVVVCKHPSQKTIKITIFGMDIILDKIHPYIKEEPIVEWGSYRNYPKIYSGLLFLIETLATATEAVKAAICQRLTVDASENHQVAVLVR